MYPILPNKYQLYLFLFKKKGEIIHKLKFTKEFQKWINIFPE